MKKVSYSHLVTLLRQEVDKITPLPDEELAYLEALNKWIEVGKKIYEKYNGSPVKNGEVRKMVREHNRLRPRRKPGPPSRGLPHSHRLNKHLRWFLSERGLLALPTNLDEHLKKIAKNIVNEVSK